MKTNKVLQFPHIPERLEMSENVKNMVFWDFPKDIDIDKELEKWHINDEFDDEVEMEEEYPVGFGASLAEVRQTVLEAKEHEDDPYYWITWKEIDEEFRNRYPEWK